MVRRIFFRIVFKLLGAAVLLAVSASAPPVSESAWSADLRLPPKPDVKQETPAEWRRHLFEEFQRYLERLKR
jgi:hypothetical protein